MKKKRIILIISIVLIGAIALVIMKNISASATKVNVRNIKTLDTTEAYKLALYEVNKVNNKAELCFMTSVDNPQKKEGDEGIDGRRRFWNLDFAVPNTDQHYLITIQDGNVTKCFPIKSSVDPNSLIKDDKNILSSSKILKKVATDYNIKPGKSWASGYHFVIGKENTQCGLSVIGTDEQDNMVRIFADSISGEIVSASRKIYKGGGIYINNKKIDFPNGWKYSIDGISVSKGIMDRESIITWGQISSNDLNENSEALMTTDGGKNWTSMNLKGNIIKIWFSDQDDSTIYAALDKQLLFSKDSGANWTKLLDSSSTIINTSAVYNRIAILTEDKIYLSEDNGNYWSNRDNTDGIISIQVGINNIIGLTNNGLLQMKENVWSKLDNPITSDLVGIKIGNDEIIAYSTSKLSILKSGNNQWKTIDINQEIKNVFVNTLSDNNYEIFIEGGDENIYQISKGGDFTKLNNNKIFLPQDGDLADLISGQNGKVYYYMIPKQTWEIITKGR